MNLKFWKKAGIAKAEAQYMNALADLCLLAREERIKRLVAHVLPGWHLHRNPVKDTGITRVKYPSGNDL